MSEATEFVGKFPFRVLSLDGGGSKGVYTLGVLKEFEALVGGPLSSHFDLIYGTSTGAIIAALLGLGMSVSSVEEKYFEIIPRVMRKRLSWTRSRALRRELEETFKEKKFDSFLTDIGIVATNYERERPMIYKTSSAQAFKGKASFLPGFGCKISDALLASTAAFPFFRRQRIKTENQGSPEVMDGGFVANNPTLFAVADALQALGATKNTIRVLSVGVGHYNEPQKRWYSKIIFSFFPFKMMNKQFAANTNTIEILRRIFFADIKCVRIDADYPDRQYDTDLLEAKEKKLLKLFVLGQESFRNCEDDIKQIYLN